ncbi:HMG (high mobility group) box protein [Ceratobasidium sp. AG-Ba]|nr:HMG (high mobility group) box protein [Ceratobasidium sp. AG-Ba]
MDGYQHGNATPGDAYLSCFDSRISQPQLLDPHLEVMYTTSTSVDFADTTSHVSSPSTMATLSDTSGFSSPASSAPSPYFTEPSTPAEPPIKKSHGRRRPPGHIPRPRNAFILFRSHYVAAQLIPGKVENDHRHISKIIGEIWNSLSPAERLLWEQKADVEKEKHSRMYPNYRYRPAKLEGVVKRRVKCRGTGIATSPYSSTPGIGNAAPREMIGSLSLAEGGDLQFVDSDKARFTDQEERRKDRARCARVAELVKLGVVGERLEQEAQRLGLDRESAMAGTPQLGASKDDPPGKQGHFHTNINVLRALGELMNNDTPAFTDPFVPHDPRISRTDTSKTTPQCVHPTKSLTPVDVRTSKPSLASKGGQPGSSLNEANKTDKNGLVWPHRRASSVPPPLPPPIYQEFDAHPHLLIVESPQVEHAFQATFFSRRASSSSPVSRHRPLLDACSLRTEDNEERASQSCQGLDAFNHVGHRSPTTSPPEYFYSPTAFPHLQLHYPSSTEASPDATLLSPLYGIDAVRSVQHSQEPIGLSTLYPSDMSNCDDSAIHSTYATPAGDASSPTPATPATTSSDYGLPALKQVDHQGTNQSLGFVHPSGHTGPYNWHTTYGSVPCYGHSSLYDVNTVRYDEDQLFTPGPSGSSY